MQIIEDLKFQSGVKGLDSYLYKWHLMKIKIEIRRWNNDDSERCQYFTVRSSMWKMSVFIIEIE